MSTKDSIPIALTHEVRDTCLCLHIQRAARAVARRYDGALNAVDLTNGQFSLMISLNRDVPANIGQLADVLGMDRSTVTANVKPLERRGLVESTASATDRRSRIVTLTGKGRRLLAAAVPEWRNAQADIERVLRSDPKTLRTELLAVLR